VAAEEAVEAAEGVDGILAEVTGKYELLSDLDQVLSLLDLLDLLNVPNHSITQFTDLLYLRFLALLCLDQCKSTTKVPLQLKASYTSSVRPHTLVVSGVATSSLAQQYEY
jgi:hypothetical protein